MEERRITQQRLDKARRLIRDGLIEPQPGAQMVTFAVAPSTEDAACYLVTVLPERAAQPLHGHPAPPSASCTCDGYRLGGYACAHILAAWELRRELAEQIDPYAA